MKNTRLLGMALLSGLCIHGLQAQESVNASGGNAAGSEGSVSYSVGQAVYSTNNGTNGDVAQGVQLPYEILELTGIQEANGIQMSVLAYPNPATDVLQLVINHKKLGDISFRLYDMSGKLLKDEKITEHQTYISISELTPASYLIKISIDNNEIKTFKIIKN